MVGQAILPILGTLRAAMLVLCLLAPTASATAQKGASEALAPAAVDWLARQVFSEVSANRQGALAVLRPRGNPDVVAALIQALRFLDGDPAIGSTLEVLTGAQNGASWHDWVLWQEAHPEIEPYDGFDELKADIMASLDPNFRLFLRRGVEHDIRLEEIVWGGVTKDGIPALLNPTHVGPQEADYLLDDELVFGVRINGDARAYPLRILDWHEMFNDVVGGVHVALAYCTLCGSGILYETRVPDREQPFVFGSSGFLYRSNKLMYDQQTHSLWNQFTGRPVVGPLTGSGIELTARPVTIPSWKNWLDRNPDTKVLSLATGHDRDYTPGAPYGTYFASPNLMFPALTTDTRLKPKDYVFALRGSENEKSWPLAAFAGGAVINDSVGDLDVVLIGDAATRTVRAYDADGRDFFAVDDRLDSVVADGETWEVGEDALVGADGRRLARLPGHVAYWFAQSGFKPGAEHFGD